MPYYRAGDYYRGDYYRGNYAAGGILGSIGKFIGGVVKTVGGNLLRATPVGMAISAVAPKLLAPSRPQIAPMSANLPSFGPGTVMSVPEPGITGAVHRIAPGGHPGYGRYTKDGRFTERRAPRMNPLNPRALRRAGRRVKGFLRFASRLGALPLSRGKSKKLFKRKRS